MKTQQQLRLDLRSRRRELSQQVQHDASQAISNRFIALSEYRRAKRIAAYVGSKGEIDPMPLLRRAHSDGKQCYLPVLHPFLPGRLWFARWTPDTPMRSNRFGIPEPAGNPGYRCLPQHLDLVVVPLLGFDDKCQRLGMGGGYYDRTFAFRRFRCHWKGPLLIGVAHELQRVARLDSQPWDVSLDKVLTPLRSYARESAG